MLRHSILGGCALTLLTFAPLQVSASEQLAVDMGCYNCHARASKVQNAPTMARLAEHMAKYRGDEAALKKRSEKLRESSLMHPIAAHEKLSPEMALTLIRWLSEDGPH